MRYVHKPWDENLYHDSNMIQLFIPRFNTSYKDTRAKYVRKSQSYFVIGVCNGRWLLALTR